MTVVQQLQESVATTAVNLSDSPKVIQTLQKELKKSGEPPVRAIKHDELGRGNSANNDRFVFVFLYIGSELIRCLRSINRTRWVLWIWICLVSKLQIQVR